MQSYTDATNKYFAMLIRAAYSNSNASCCYAYYCITVLHWDVVHIIVLLCELFCCYAYGCITLRYYAYYCVSMLRVAMRVVVTMLLLAMRVICLVCLVTKHVIVLLCFFLLCVLLLCYYACYCVTITKNVKLIDIFVISMTF